LVTTSVPGTAIGQAGVLGTGTTGILFGGPKTDNDFLTGGRFTAGFWCDQCRTFGFEAGFFGLAQHNRFLAASQGDVILARPFTDAVTGLPNAQLVAFPGVLSGSVAVNQASTLWGAEANARWMLDCGHTIYGFCYRTDLLAGIRYVELDESLGVTESLVVPAGSAVARAAGPATIMVSDRFRTDNQFYGGQVGTDTEFRNGHWVIDLTGKVALGTVHETLNINGNTALSIPGVFTSAAGGLLVQPTNIGHRGRDRFAVVPQVGLKVGYQVNEHIRVYAGYDFMYISRVIRPGDQIDPAVNVSQLPTIFGPNTLQGVARPLATFKESDFWAQGANFGIEFRY
jgi:hypothetical protein